MIAAAAVGLNDKFQLNIGLKEFLPRGDSSSSRGPPDFVVQVIPIDQRGQLKEAFNIRLEELQVIDLQFLFVEKEHLPTILVLYQDPKEMRHLKTYEVKCPCEYAHDDQAQDVCM